MDPRNNNPFDTDNTVEFKSESAANTALAATTNSQRATLKKQLIDARYNWLYGDYRHRKFWAEKMRSIRAVATALKLEI